MKTRHAVLWISIIVVASGILFVFTNGHRSEGNGTILLNGVPAGATIFLDNKREKRVDDSLVPRALTDLSIGTHTVVVAKDGYWPWSKKIVVAHNESISLNVFVIAQEPAREIIKLTDKRYQTIRTAVEAYKLPHEPYPLTSEDGTTNVWATDTAILARWVSMEKPNAPFCITGVCDTTLTVLQIDLPIRDLAFLPARNDIIVFSAQNGIFALELDKRGTQNFEPIYLGVAPEFALLEKGVLAVIDEKILFLIHF
ncbi:MAG TPA: PEGA domain-containing protein [Candidatus Paceibacterota bacterium]